MNVSFLDAARRELKEAVAYYNNEQPGLGAEFSAEIKQTISRIRKNPEAWQSLSKHTRRCISHRFSYAVIYQILNGDVLIVAVMHLHRDPHSWRGRAPND